MKTAQFHALCAESAQGVAECLGILLAKLDVAELSAERLEVLSLEMHALSTQNFVFKVRAVGEMTARKETPRAS